MGDARDAQARAALDQGLGPESMDNEALIQLGQAINILENVGEGRVAEMLRVIYGLDGDNVLVPDRISVLTPQEAEKINNIHSNSKWILGLTGLTFLMLGAGGAALYFVGWPYLENLKKSFQILSKSTKEAYKAIKGQ